MSEEQSLLYSGLCKSGFVRKKYEKIGYTQLERKETKRKERKNRRRSLDGNDNESPYLYNLPISVDSPPSISSRYRLAIVQ